MCDCVLISKITLINRENSLDATFVCQITFAVALITSVNGCRYFTTKYIRFDATYCDHPTHSETIESIAITARITIIAVTLFYKNNFIRTRGSFLLKI